MKYSTRRVYALWNTHRWMLLPYGIWTTDNGEVLFNRRYEPIYKRWPLEACADPDWWVGWKSQKHFYNDGTPEFDKVRAGLKVLAEWGIDPPKAWMKNYMPKAS